MITYGSSSRYLAEAVGRECNIKVVESICRRFPDGEQYVRVLGDVRGEDVVLFQSLAFSPDSLLLEFIFLADALRAAGCRSITAVIPYLAYLRQDSRFHHGEALSARVVASLIESYADRLITVDAHLHRFKSLSELFRIPSLNLTAMPILAEYYRRNFGTEETVVVAPDIEAEQWAKIVAEHLSLPYTIFEKERLGDKEVSITLKDGGLVREKNVIIVDDIISTGATLIEVLSRLFKERAKKVDALVTHALLVEGAYERLKGAGLGEIISTDTVQSRSSKVSVAPIIAEAIMRRL
ncbi:MAG: ribose-phosphate diphosphokinase [Candidatus Methanomethyliales bacterium]|nr:ribose-phosphate diphosphokinase [Candidatus Methanomethylicales archaeon]